MDLEEMQKKANAAMAEAGVPTEQEMRDTQAAWPKSEDELMAEIRKLVDRPHDYGTCVYALSMGALAAFNYIASRLGVTGFQASCADLDILKRNRHIELGFVVIPYDEMMYPQYWRGEYAKRRPFYEDALRENPQPYADKARKLIAEGGGHDEVRRHWVWLASLAPAKEVANGEAVEG